MHCHKLKDWRDAQVEQMTTGWISSYQVVVWFDPKQVPEVAKCQRGVGLEAEVGVVVSWSQVAALTGERKTELNIRRTIPKLSPRPNIASSDVGFQGPRCCVISMYWTDFQRLFCD